MLIKKSKKEKTQKSLFNMTNNIKDDNIYINSFNIDWISQCNIKVNKSNNILE